MCVCVLLVVFVGVFVLQTFSWLSANRISGAAVALLSFHLISSPLSPPPPPPLPLALLPLFPPHPPTPPLTSCHVLFNMMRTKRGLNLITRPLYTTFFFKCFLLFCVSGFLCFLGFQVVGSCKYSCLPPVRTHLPLGSTRACKANGSESERCVVQISREK